MTERRIAGRLQRLTLCALVGWVLGCGGGEQEGPARPEEAFGAETGEAAEGRAEDAVSPAGGPEGEGPGRAHGLRAAIDVGAQAVEGELEGVRFEARASGETGAWARFWWQGEADAALAVAVEGPASGSMEWKGVRLDGYGALSAAEEEALLDLEQALPAMTVARIALDLACREGAGELPPAVGAALLMPTQMALKYRTPSAQLAPAIRRMAAQSECQHLRGPLETIDPERSPAPGIVALSDAAPIPLAAGYFPFDGEGGR